MTSLPKTSVRFSTVIYPGGGIKGRWNIDYTTGVPYETRGGEFIHPQNVVRIIAGVLKADTTKLNKIAAKTQVLPKVIAP